MKNKTSRKPAGHNVNAKSLVRILNQARRNTKLANLTNLYFERLKLKEARTKLAEKIQANAQAMREVQAQPVIEQFTFRF